MYGDVHEPAFAAGFDIRNNIHRIRVQLTARYDPHSALTLGKKHTAVRKPCECPWNLQAICYCFDTEPDLTIFGIKCFAIGDSSWRGGGAAERGNHKQESVSD